MLLKDKVVFLTGGSMGIGYECAKAYVKEGALVCIIGKEEDSVFEVINELGDPHMGIVCDVTKEAEVKDAIVNAVKFFERIDAIHNNAGITTPSKSLHETNLEEWDDVFNTNLKSIYFTTRYGIDAIRKTKGCILNTSSLVGEIGQEMHAAYSATKGGVNALTNQWRSIMPSSEYESMRYVLPESGHPRFTLGAGSSPPKKASMNTSTKFMLSGIAHQVTLLQMHVFSSYPKKLDLSQVAHFQ